MLARGLCREQTRTGEARKVAWAHLAPVHLEGAGGVLDHGRGRVRGHHHRHAQLAVGTEEQREKALLGNGVEHAGGLVKKQEPRAHDQRRGKGKKLTLAARELGCVGAKPRLHAKEVAGLGHASAHLGLRHAEVLHTKGHLVPDGVADHLSVRALEDVAHQSSGLQGRELPRRATKDANLPPQVANGSDLGLGQAQKRGLARARPANEKDKRTLGHVQLGLLKHGRRGTGIGKANAAHLQGRARGRLRSAHSKDLQRSRSASAAALGSSMRTA